LCLRPDGHGASTAIDVWTAARTASRHGHGGGALGVATDPDGRRSRRRGSRCLRGDRASARRCVEQSNRLRGADMQYVRLGSSGLKVSRIALGMMSYGDPRSRPWHLAEDAAEPIVRRAAESGVTFFDTADMYSEGASEEIAGRLLGKLFARRDDY